MGFIFLSFHTYIYHRAAVTLCYSGFCVFWLISAYSKQQLNTLKFDELLFFSRKGVTMELFVTVVSCICYLYKGMWEMALLRMAAG